MPYGTTGRKEVAEAVIIAALSAFATALVNWGVESARSAATKRQEAAKAPAPPQKAADEATP